MLKPLLYVVDLATKIHNFSIYSLKVKTKRVGLSSVESCYNPPNLYTHSSPPPHMTDFGPRSAYEVTMVLQICLLKYIIWFDWKMGLILTRP